LDAIRWELDEELIPVPEIELDFRDMGGRDVTEFIERITFSRIGAKLDITALDQSLDGNIALSITSPPLGFAAAADPLVLRKGENSLYSSASEASPVTLDLMANPIVPINVAFVPVIDGTPMAGGRYLKLGPLYIADDQEETRLNLSAEVSLDFVWMEADVNLTSLLGDGYNLSGGVPDEPINIREALGDFMSDGFTFADGSLDIGLFLDGPVDIVTKIAPTFTLTAYTGGGSDVILFSDSVRIEGGFPTLPDDMGEWEKPGLPPGGLQGIDTDGFIDIFASKPEALSFFYEVELGTGGVITVEPEMFYGAEAGDIRALVLIKLALEFDVATTAPAYFSLPFFEDETDLFGRSGLAEPLFNDLDLNINLLRLRLDFDDSIFGGARLHIDGSGSEVPDEDRLFGEEGLPLNRGRGDYVEVRITGNDWDIINRRLIPPDIRIEYPHATRVRIPRDPLPTRFTIAVNGSITLNIND